MNIREAVAEIGDISVVELAIIVIAIVMTIIGITMVWPQLF